MQRKASELGMRYVISPFRPSAYGKYKAERQATHSSALFNDYCNLKTNEGLPKDPWLRSLAFQGAEFIKIEPRSVRVQHSLETFRMFKQRYKPEAWYSPMPDVWECGETPTWYVDRGLKVVISVEPNLWGRIPVEAHKNELFCRQQL